MKQLSTLIAAFAVTAFAMAPGTTYADDNELEDLEVTMDVVDDVTGIDDMITEMPGPAEVDGYLFDEVAGDGEIGAYDEAASTDGDAEADAGEGADLEQDTRFERQEDDFVIDEDFTEVDEDFDREGDFEEGEDIDDDSYDFPMDDGDDMDDMDDMEEDIV